jgi:4-diphosphocytidyl-2-C-methyl-D-erythritol kinase
MTRLERDSPCKINLLLNILGKRPDNFHELETVMHPIGLRDTLSFARVVHPGVELSCSHPALPVDGTNLVHRAATCFLEAHRIREGVRIHLEKRVPLAAGLGGGSSNAAMTLLALGELFQQPLAPGQLQTIAASLGSDVPFFLQSQPALATGRGEKIQPLGLFPALRDTVVLLIHPGFGVSTAWAYQALAQFPDALQGRPERARELITALRGDSIDRAIPLFYNSLEVPVLRKYPILRLYQDWLCAHGAMATLMSGSGSTTFALVAGANQAMQLAESFLGAFGKTNWTAVAPLASPHPNSSSGA